ncbi:hypothetical protein DH2020_030486 [Rehmannia glutinosa]|uniref:Uncharacterized protein n=1 Tax=Rehmannia glutinosa TaxID=99300 RepID=A0ABR0VNM1_REHGL
MSLSSVHVKEAVLITPSQPTPNHTLQLSALDSQLFVRFTFEYLLVYEPRHGFDRAAIKNNVKSALGRALVPYYPLAGRVRTRADGLGLEVVCRAQGAVFIDAVSDCTVSEFEEGPKRRAQWRKFLSLHVADVLKGGSPLVVQLTWLSDGGATLAVGFNHCMCDGIGSGEFLNLFAELAMGNRGLAELKSKPVWSRHLLDWTGHTNPLGHPEFRSVPDLCGWARALKLPSNQIVKLIFSVNIRDRVEPALPSGYYGNAFVLGCAYTRVGDLGDRGLGYAVELVMRAKESVRDEYVREVVESVSLTRASVVDPVGVLIMTQWSRLGLESVDFGIGRPVQVGPVCCDKYCVLLPICGVASGIKVNLAIPSSAVDQYLYFLRNICA